MRSTRPRKDGTSADGAVVRTLVISQHEAVRRQLVLYLSRSPALSVGGDAFTPEAIIRARPDVLVLDLSQLCQAGLGAALDAARQVGARLIALASMREPADERAVTNSGGLYRLKAAGADGLADVVHDVASRPTSSRRQTASTP